MRCSKALTPYLCRFTRRMDYSPLEKLADELQSKIKNLKSGNMKPDEVSGLVKSAREVYERLVILEFQANEKKEPKSQEIPAFKIETEEPSDKESTLDVEEEEIVIESTKDLESSNPEIKIDVPTPKQPEAIEKKEKVPVVAETVIEVLEKEEESESLAEKFEHAPIEDIAKSISLNEKFQFIRVLCGNNSQTFNALLERINASGDEASALKTFSSLIPQPEEEDDKDVYEKFQELIKRRF